jgi:hypothetical protein
LVKHGRTPHRRTPVPGKTPGAAHRVFLTLQNTGGFCLDICIMQWFGPARPPVRNLPTGHCSSLLFLPDAKIFRHEGRSRSPVHGRLQTLVGLVGRSLPLPYARPSLVSRDLDRATCPMSGRQDGGRPKPPGVARAYGLPVGAGVRLGDDAAMDAASGMSSGPSEGLRGGRGRNCLRGCPRKS